MGICPPIWSITEAHASFGVYASSMSIQPKCSPYLKLMLHLGCTPQACLYALKASPVWLSQIWRRAFLGSPASRLKPQMLLNMPNRSCSVVKGMSVLIKGFMRLTGHQQSLVFRHTAGVPKCLGAGHEPRVSPVDYCSLICTFLLFEYHFKNITYNPKTKIAQARVLFRSPIFTQKLGPVGIWIHSVTGFSC